MPEMRIRPGRLTVAPGRGSVILTPGVTERRRLTVLLGEDYASGSTSGRTWEGTEETWEELGVTWEEA